MMITMQIVVNVPVITHSTGKINIHTNNSSVVCLNCLYLHTIGYTAISWAQDGFRSLEVSTYTIFLFDLKKFTVLQIANVNF